MSEWCKGKVSIVIPVYNSKKYLDACLESVTSQTYDNLEVIIVDGESVDGSPEIIRRYAEQYPFVKAVSIENRGVSLSRNYGMELADGEYLQFVDSDDFLFPDSCERLVKAAGETGADLVIAGFEIMKTGEMRAPKEGIYAGADAWAKELTEYYYYKRNCMNTPWNKLYRREGLTAQFPEGLSMGEDLMFNLQVIEKAAKIAVIPDIIYRYNNVNDQSLAYRYREDGFEIESMIQREMLGFAKRHGAGSPRVLYENYLFGIKTKITALVHKSGKKRHACQKKIKEWTGFPEVRELLESGYSWGKKDRILLFFLRHHCGRCLYWYYRIMA